VMTQPNPIWSELQGSGECGLRSCLRIASLAQHQVWIYSCWLPRSRRVGQV
jgi:hypothetical protein